MSPNPVHNSLVGYSRPRHIYGVLPGSSGANRYQATDGDPLPTAGLGAGSYWARGTIWRLNSLVAASRMLNAKSDNATVGWQGCYMGSNHGITFYLVNAAGTWIPVTVAFHSAPDVGKIHMQVVTGYVDNSIGFMRHFFNRSVIGQVSALGIRTSTSPEAIGAQSDGQAPANGIALVGTFSVRGSVTDAQVQSWFDDAKRYGDVPKSFAGATILERYSVRDSVVNGAVPKIYDTNHMTSSPQDMVKQGSPTVVAYPLPQTWGW